MRGPSRRSASDSHRFTLLQFASTVSTVPFTSKKKIASINDLWRNSGLLVSPLEIFSSLEAMVRVEKICFENAFRPRSCDITRRKIILAKCSPFGCITAKHRTSKKTVHLTDPIKPATGKVISIDTEIRVPIKGHSSCIRAEVIAARRRCTMILVAIAAWKEARKKKEEASKNSPINSPLQAKRISVRKLFENKLSCGTCRSDTR